MIQNEMHRETSVDRKMLMENEKGNALIYTLILLVLLTIIGLAASQTATVDIQVAGNHMRYKKNFYRAEGAALDAIQRMEDTDLGSTSLDFISVNPSIVTDVEVAANWQGVNTLGGVTAVASEIDTAHAKFVAYSEGVIHTGESLDMTKTKIFQYKVFGRCEENNGTSLIEIGYRRVQ